MNISKYLQNLEPQEERTEKKIEVIDTFSEHITIYQNVIFEENSYRKQGKTKEEFLTYDKSLERIKSIDPNSRHARPSEIFSLLCDNLEGKLDQEHKIIANNMLLNSIEWRSCAFERKENLLIIYIDPEGLVWNKQKRKYEKNHFKYTDKKIINIKEKPSEQVIKLKEFDEEFTKTIYSRKYQGLPETIQQEARIWLSSNNTLWPVVSNRWSTCYVNYYNFRAASRRVTIV